MVCVYCGSKTRVINSRGQKRSNQVWRRRKCIGCEAIFTSHESWQLSTAYFVKRGERREPFLTDKLYTEVLLALQDHKDCFEAAREVTATIIQKLHKSSEKPLYMPQTISQTTSGVLKRFDRRAWLRYVAEHPSLEF